MIVPIIVAAIYQDAIQVEPNKHFFNMSHIPFIKPSAKQLLYLSSAHNGNETINQNEYNFIFLKI